MGGGASRAAHLTAIERSFLGVLLPDSEWSPFCDLWKHERDGKFLSLRNKLCFIVVTGRVAVHVHTSKSVQNTEDPEIIRHFKAGEVLHLFSNQDKIPHDGDGTTLVFDNISLSFVPEKGTTVIGLDVAEYLSFIEHRPLLTSLAAFMRLKMSDLVTNHIYFEGVSPSKVNMLGPFLSLRRAHPNDVLFKRGSNNQSNAESSMGLVVSGVCLALYDDEDIESIKVLIRDNNTTDPPCVEGTGCPSPSRGHAYFERNDVSVYGGNGANRRRVNVLESITATMQLVTGTSDSSDLPVEHALEKRGEVLQSGSIYGFEHLVLPDQKGFKNVLAVKNSVIAHIDSAIFSRLQKFDQGLCKTVTRNVAFSLLDSLSPVVPLLAELERASCMSLSSKVNFETYLAGTVIFQEGGTGTKFYILLQGETKEWLRSSEDGSDIDRSFFIGDYFGEVAIMTGSAYTSTMIATADCILVAFSEKALRLVLRDDQAKLAEMKLRMKGSDLELANILNFPPACALFEEYIIGEHAPENLFFWKAVERFEDICQRLERQIEKMRTGDGTTQSQKRYPDIDEDECQSVSTGIGAVCTGPRANSMMRLRLKTTASTMTMSLKTSSSRRLFEDRERDRERDTDADRERESCANTGVLVDDPASAAYVKSTTLPSRTSTVDPANLAVYTTSSILALHEGFAQLRDVVQIMMKEYVLEGSSNQVNFPGKLRVQLEKDVSAWMDTTSSLSRKVKVKDIEEEKEKEKEKEKAKEKEKKREDPFKALDQDMPLKGDSKRVKLSWSYKDYNVPKELFLKAKSECYMIMRKDTFARWRFTDKFAEFFDGLQPLANAKINVVSESLNEAERQGVGLGSRVGSGMGAGSGPSSGSGIVIPNAPSSPLKGLVPGISSPLLTRQQLLLPGYLPSTMQPSFAHLSIAKANSQSNSSISAISTISTSCKVHTDKTSPFE